MEKSRIKEMLIGLITVIIVVVIGILNSHSTDHDSDSTANNTTTQTVESTASAPETDTPDTTALTFRNEKLLQQHYEKHGVEMGFSSAEEYEAAASAVANNPDALHKQEAEDGDDVYYLEDTNEFVIVSTDGYIRTYFNPSAGMDYFNRQ